MEEQKPYVLILQETKVSDPLDPIFNLIWRHPWHVEVVPSIGLSGGIVVAWNSDFINVKDSLKGVFTLSLVCSEVDSDFEWVLTGVYGP
ncbi:hypothetical protein FRX31_026135, partial [Thalictrum thalictroides]